tara:strand:+ start:175 stop:429 length:255 start_codon:yes stop_codon:yes gene_type:complete
MKNLFLYKAIISAFIASIFIYFRKLDYYKTLPRKKIWVSVVVFIWSVATLTEPFFLPIGLVILNLLGDKHDFIQENTNKNSLDA